MPWRRGLHRQWYRLRLPPWTFDFKGREIESRKGIGRAAALKNKMPDKNDPTHSSG
jgi:hypothetical protein